MWVAREVMPHEHLVRAWLQRSLVPAEDIDDLIQEAYCRLASLDAYEQITRPDAFFFQVVRNLLLNQLRHRRVVRIETVAELDELGSQDSGPTPEEVVGARRDYARVRALIDALPERCRRIFVMRKIERLPQREIAARMGVSENVVEQEGAKGLRLILQALRDQGMDIGPAAGQRRLRRGKVKRDV